MADESSTSAARCTGDDSCKVPEHWPDPASSGPHRGPTSAAAKNILIDREGKMLAVFVDGQRVIGFDRKNALLIAAAISKAAAEWDDLPWVVDRD